MEMVPIVYVSDTARSARFYECLGAELGPGGVNPFWTEMKLGGRRFALHGTGDDDAHAPGDESPDDESAGDGEGGPAAERRNGGRLGLSLVVDRPLEEVRDRLAAAGVSVRRDIADEPFGRSMVIEDPDGLTMQVNEHDPDRHADW